jgi:hypothetical protein
LPESHSRGSANLPGNLPQGIPLSGTNKIPVRGWQSLKGFQLG